MLNSKEERLETYNQVVARYYDAAYATLPNLGSDREFYVAKGQALGGAVLELGCGTGRVLLSMAAAGLDCTGLDASRAMLDLLKKKPGAGALSLVQSQMQDFDLLPRRFRFVYSAFRAMQHLYGVEDQLSCLDAVLQHLEPGGQLAFDVFAPKLERISVEQEPENQDLQFDFEGDRVFRYTSVERDHARQLQRLDMRFERRRNGQVVSDEFESIGMRWFHRYELEHLLHRAGFVDVEIFGDFDGSPVTKRSPAFVVVARAPG